MITNINEEKHGQFHVRKESDHTDFVAVSLGMIFSNLF